MEKVFFHEDYASLSTYSIFAKPKYPINEAFKIYGLIGFGGVSVDAVKGSMPAANPGVNISNEGGFQWGVGANYSITTSVEIFVDYSQLMIDSEIDTKLYYYDNATYKELNTDALTIGVTYSF